MLLHGGTSATDLGVIEVTTKFWASTKDPPVSPFIAEWKVGSETDPFAVKKQTPPVKEPRSATPAKPPARVAEKSSTQG